MDARPQTIIRVCNLKDASDPKRRRRKHPMTKNEFYDLENKMFRGYADLMHGYKSRQFKAVCNTYKRATGVT